MAADAAASLPQTTSEYAVGYNTWTAWWAVCVFVIFQMVSVLDRTVITVLIPEMRTDLGLNDFQISLVQGMAFALFYGAMGLIIGGLVDRYSRRTIMFGGIVIWSIAAAFTGLARNYVQLFAARIWVGFGEGSITPSAQSLLASIFPRDRLSTPICCFNAAAVAGSAFSYIAGGVLLELLTRAPLFHGLAAWRQVMIVTGAPGVAIAWLAFTVREPRRPVRSADYVRAASWSAFFRFLRCNLRLMGGILGGFGLLSMAVIGTMGWAPTYARRILGISPSRVGEFMGLAVGIGGVFGSIGLGLLIDWSFRRGHRDMALRSLVWMAAIVPPIVAASFLTGNAPLMFAAMALLLMTLGASFGPAFAAIQMISPPEMRGRFSALGILITNLGGGAFGPMAIGALTDYGFGDPQKLGLAIATSLFILGPAAGFAVWWARPVFVARLNEIQSARMGD